MGENVRFIQGNEACVEAAIAAGVRFFAGYPITPSTEIAEILSVRLPQVGGRFIQMEDEIASMGALLGASLTGYKAMTATSGPGFSLMQELIGFAALCEIPCVIVNVQRGGPSTGLPTSPSQSDVMQARWGTHGEHPIVVLAPSSVKDSYDLTIKAINISEELRNPVILLSDEVVAHMYEKITLPDEGSLHISERPKPDKKNDNKKYLPFATRSPKDVPRIADFGTGFRFNVTGLIHDTDGFPVNVPQKTDALLKRLYEKIDSRIKEITVYDAEGMDESIILCSYGATARSSRQAREEALKEGIGVGIITLKTIWPFPDFIFEKIRDKAVVVCEMNLGQVVREVKRVSNGNFTVHGVHSARGTMITPDEILDKIRGIKKC